MSEAITLEAVLTRDRAIVLAGVVGLSALAWAYLLALAWRMPHEDMAMAMAMPHMLGSGRGRPHLGHVGRDDGRHDDALGRPDDLDVCREPPASGPAGAVGPHRGVRARLSPRLGRLQCGGDPRAVGTAYRGAAVPHDRRHESGRGRPPARRGGDFSVDAAQVHVPRRAAPRSAFS